MPDDTYVRDGNNLLYELYISYPEAVLGGKKEIPTVEGGKVRISLEKGTQGGKILRLKGKGLPDLQQGGRGDMLVYVNVWTPQNLTKEQERFFQQAATQAQFAPQPTGTDRKSFRDRLREMFR